MRFAIIVLVIVVAALAQAEQLKTQTDIDGHDSAVDYQWQPAKEIVVKWLQLPDFTLLALSSEYMTDFDYWMECADDFYCDDGSPIVALEWWGIDWTNTVIDYFVVRFYTDVPDGRFSHPGDLLYEGTIDSWVATYLPDPDAVHYEADLPVSFQQQAGNIYWVSIQAYHSYLVGGGQWFWSQCLPSEYWNDEATARSEYHGFPDWTNMTAALGYYAEMAFVLYADVTSPVEDTTWAGIKALYK